MARNLYDVATMSDAPTLIYNPTQLTFGSPNFSVYNGKPRNYNALTQGTYKNEDRRYKTADTIAAIDLTFSTIGQQLHQDAETASWFEGFQDKYKNQVDILMRAGDYGNANFYGKMAAAAAMKDPEFIARAKTNKQYEAAKADADKKLNEGKINQDIYNQWMEENDYKFNPIVDNNGNVIGGKDYTPSWMPVKQADLTDFYKELQQVVTRRQGSSEQVVFLDINGKETTNPANGFYGMAYKKGNSYTHIDHDTLVSAFKELYEANPELKASLQQDYNNLLWKYNKASKDEKSSFYGSDIMDNQGVYYSFNDYVAKRVTPDLKYYQQHRVDTTMSAGDAYGKYAKAQLEKAAAEKMIDASTAKGMIFEIDRKSDVSDTYNGISNALKTIEDIYLDIDSKNYAWAKNKLNDKRYTDAKANGDFVAMADYLSKHAMLTGDDRVVDAIRTLRHQGKLFNAMTSNLEKDDKDALIAYAAWNSNQDITNASGNKYAKDIAKAKNKLFSYTEEGKIKRTNSFGLQFDNANLLKQFISELGLTSESELMNHGLTLRNEDGVALEVDKNSPLLRQIANLNNKYNSNVIHWNDKGNIIKASSYIQPNENNSVAQEIAKNKYKAPMFYDKYDDIGLHLQGIFAHPSYSGINTLHALSDEGLGKKLSDAASNSLRKKNLKYQEGQTYPFSDWNVIETYNQVGTTYTLNEANSVHTKLDESNMEVAIQALASKNNSFVIWKTDKDGITRQVPLKDIADIKDKLVQAMSNGYSTMSATYAPNGKTGTTITITPKEDSNGKLKGEIENYFVEDLLHNAATSALLKTKNFSSLQLYNKYMAFDTPQQNIFGDIIDYNSPNAEKEFAASQMYEQIQNRLHDFADKRQPVSREDVINAAAAILQEQGITNSSVGQERYNTLLAIIVGQLTTHYNNSLR